MNVVNGMISKIQKLGFFEGIKPFATNNLWVAGTTFFKALSQLVVIKMITVYLGSEGLGLMGQAMSCVVAVNSLLSGGLLNFSVTEFSKSLKSPADRAKVFQALGFWLLIVNVVAFITVILFSDQLADRIFHDPTKEWFFYTLAFFTLCFNAHSICTGLLSAESDVKRIFKSHFLSFLTVTAFLFLILKNTSSSAPFIAAFILLVVQSFWLLYFCLRSGKLQFHFFKPHFEKHLMLRILKFSLIMVCTGLVTMLYQIAMRSHIVHHSNSDWADVGRWQSIIKVSEITMSFLGLSILTSYLPQVSRLTDIFELRRYVIQFASKYVVLTIGILAGLILLAPLVLRILYDSSFMELSNLLRLQLAGDLFKLTGWLCSYFLLARFPLVLFLGFELSYIALLYFISLSLHARYGIDGLIYANLVSNAIFLVFGLIVVGIYFQKQSKASGSPVK